MYKFAATEFQPTAKQGKAWGGAAAFKRAKGAREMLHRIRKMNPELTAQQAFKQMRAGADKSMFNGWTKEDMNLFIDRYVTNDPNQNNYYNHGKLFSDKKGHLFNQRSALDEDRLIDRPFGQAAATIRSGAASLASGAVSGFTFIPELAWSGAKTLAGGLSGKGWKWRSTDWNPFDKLNVESGVADYKTAGKTLQRGVNAAGEAAGFLVSPALSGQLARAGSVMGRGTHGVMRSGKLAGRFAKKTGKDVLQARVAGASRALQHNAKQIWANGKQMLTNPVAAMKDTGKAMAKNFKRSPWGTTFETATNMAFGPGAVAYSMISGPDKPMNDYYSWGRTPDFSGAVNASGEQVYY